MHCYIYRTTYKQYLLECERNYLWNCKLMMELTLNKTELYLFTSMYTIQIAYQTNDNNTKLNWFKFELVICIYDKIIIVEALYITYTENIYLLNV